MKIVQITNDTILAKVEESDNIDLADFIFPSPDTDKKLDNVMSLLAEKLDKNFNIYSINSFQVETSDNEAYFKFTYDIEKSTESPELYKKLNKLNYYKGVLDDLNSVVTKTNMLVTKTLKEISDEINIKAKISKLDKEVNAISNQQAYDYLRPSIIKKYLDDNVVAQDEAKKILSVAAHNHFKRLYLMDNNIRCDKSNIMLIGPSGSGKTELVRHLSKYLNVPFVIVDATSFTEAGYVGDDVESIIYRLWINADKDNTKTESGIVFIDEIDKLRSGTGRGVGDKGVQQSLLKLIEGTDVTFPADGRRNSMAPNITINTDKILFICGGAFDGILQTNENVSRSLGFGNNLADKEDRKQEYSEITADDLIKYGMIPELVGRIPVIARLNPLTNEDLVKILTEPKDSIINQYKRLFDLENIDLVFKDDALSAIANRIDSQKTGARNLRSVIEQTMLDIMYDIPDLISEKKNISKCIINKDVIEKKCKPKLTYHSKKVTNNLIMSE